MIRWSLRSLLISAFILRVYPLSAEDYGGYRIPEIYAPSRYEVDITVPEDVFNGESLLFWGRVQITFRVESATREIQIHTRSTVTEVALTAASNTVTVTSFAQYNSTTQILTISLGQELVVGVDYALAISYNGELDTTIFRGFYLSSYKAASGTTEYLVATQFEPTHARHAFPCFDEPKYKAKFQVSITRPATYNVLSNTNVASDVVVNSTFTKSTFTETPRMSTYLLAFIVSKFTCTAGDVIAAGVPHRVCSRPEQADYRALAVELGPPIMRSLENITGSKYGDQIAKMDQVAIPDFASGAMENWAMVTYRETNLLWSAEDSSNSYRKSIALVIAHEFTHMWFGNLVTCDWWDYIFLNEGFARFYQYFAAAPVSQLSNWELDKQFVVEQVHTALLSDSSTGSDALTSKASSPSQISNKFSTIAYNKGASILRMVQHVIGADNFLSGIRHYLSTYSYSTAVPSYLWGSLNNFTSSSSLPDGVTLNAALTNWIDAAGYPVVTVTSDGDDVILSQKRFLLSGSATTQWYVPISYTLSNDTSSFTATSAKIWLTPGANRTLKGALKGNHWIVLNNQQSGYYRVNYDDALWGAIKETLRSNHTSIDVLNRAQLLNDVYNFARSGLVKYSDALSVFSYLKNEEEYYPWYAAIVGLNHLLQRIGYESAVGKRLVAHQLENLQKVYATVPFSKLDSNDQVYTTKQVTVITRVCRYGESTCVAHVKDLFAQYKNGKSVDKNLRSIVYCNALRYSDDIEADFNFLWEQFRKTSLASEVVTILGSFGCAQDSKHLKWFLNQTINATSGIRLQDFSTAWSSVYSSGGKLGAIAAMEFIAENYAALTSYYSDVGSLVASIANYFYAEEQLQALQMLIDLPGISASHNATAVSALNSVKSNMAWAAAKAADVVSFLDEVQSSGSRGLMKGGSWWLAFTSIVVVRRGLWRNEVTSLGASRNMQLPYSRFAGLALCFLCLGYASITMTSPLSGGYRLSDNYLPSKYRVELVIPAEIFSRKNLDYSGTVALTFRVKKTTQHIQIHTRSTVLDVSLWNGQSSIHLAGGGHYNSTTEILAFPTPLELKPGTNYTLKISYQDKVQDKILKGLYLSNYKKRSGNVEYLVATQFEPVYARWVFPCFDEPSYKAKFELSVVHPSKYNVISNTEVSTTVRNGTYTKTTFRETPVMSTYSLALVISKFTCTNGSRIDGELEYRVCSREEASQDRALTLEHGTRIMESLENITGIKYGGNASSITKIDHVAIPDFDSGAMENWGIVTYREVGLLWNQQLSTDANAKAILLLVTHESSHMWFGNLVTCVWWDYLFLNEGFAKYFEYFALARLSALSRWELDKQFVIDQVYTALQVDSRSDSVALTSAALTPSEISAKFNKITYSKGASILRMLERSLGSETFVSGIRQYLRIYAYHTVVPTDLWRSLGAVAPNSVLPDGVSLDVIMGNWTNRPGYPVVTASVRGDDVVLSQERFSLGKTTSCSWYVPITYTASNNTSAFSETTVKLWLRPGETVTMRNVLRTNSWIIFNNQQSGFYRVNYDPTLWANLIRVLKSNHRVIDVLNRAALVNDAYNLARSGAIRYSLALTVLSYLENDTEYYPWTSGLMAIKHLHRRLSGYPALSDLVAAYALDRLRKVSSIALYGDVNPESQIDKLKQVAILSALCEYGEPRCVTTARALFERYKEGAQVPKNLKILIYCNALRYSDDVDSDFGFLWKVLQEAAGQASEMGAVLQSLGCIRNSTYLNWFLLQTVHQPPGVRLQDVLQAWTSVYANGGHLGTTVTLRFVLDNYVRIRDYSQENLDKLIKNIGTFVTTTDQLRMLEALTKHPNISEEHKSAVETALKEAKYEIESMAVRVHEIREFFDEFRDGSSVSRVAPGMLLSVAVVVLLATIQSFD
ncbi:uncharacterized protein LOC132702417 [Cylas formicarius]|uniref:uncharacterized protein LOC132702417 n=1 Tax=Cylas formicarius TaxID=197179 RepID=UPI002958449E|nr:uncharacterized protein LOC132702417 [Cylas formicarius]